MHLIRTILAVCLTLIPVFAFATPSSYDNEAWKAFIEEGKTSTLPDGVPTGPGAVSRYNGTGFWPSNYIQITKPFDLSKSKGLIFSTQAQVDKAYFASETVKDFLEATLAEAKKLSNNDQFQIPIHELFYNESDVPLMILSRHVSNIALGLYFFDNNKSVPVANVSINGKDIKEFRTQKTRQSYESRILEKYQPLTQKQLSNLKKMVDKEDKNLRKKLGDLFTEARELSTKDKNNIRELQTNIKLTHTHKHTKTSEIDREKRIQDNRAAERLPPGKKQALFKAKTPIPNLDVKSLWILIQAMLTQNSAQVVEFRMPAELKDMIVSHARSNNTNAALITQFESLYIESPHMFEISLGCSVRDRFLGCKIGADDKTEKKVTEVASAMLNAAKNASSKRKLEILQLVVNANPVEIEKYFDTSDLDSSRIVREFKDIPIKGETQEDRNKRIKAGKQAAIQDLQDRAMDDDVYDYDDDMGGSRLFRNDDMDYSFDDDDNKIKIRKKDADQNKSDKKNNKKNSKTGKKNRRIKDVEMELPFDKDGDKNQEIVIKKFSYVDPDEEPREELPF